LETDVRIYVSMEGPNCPICLVDSIPIGPAIGYNQHFECPNPRCPVTGFRVDEGILTSIWLGKQPMEKCKCINDHTKIQKLDVRSMSALTKKKFFVWDDLCRKFLKRKDRTKIEQQAIKKLKNWRPRYGEGYCPPYFPENIDN
jgi:hypothetical protein